MTELTQDLTTAQGDAKVLRNMAWRVEAAEKKATEEATRVTELAQNLTTARGQAEEFRNTAKRVGTVESTVAELEHNLREAREEANEERRSNGRLIAKLEKTEEELKKKEREATDIRHLESELEKAREEAEGAFKSGFAAAMSQTSQVSPHDQISLSRPPSSPNSAHSPSPNKGPTSSSTTTTSHRYPSSPPRKPRNSLVSNHDQTFSVWTTICLLRPDLDLRLPLSHNASPSPTPFYFQPPNKQHRRDLL